MRALGTALLAGCIAAARAAAADGSICPAPSTAASLSLAPIAVPTCAPSEAPRPSAKPAPTRADDTDVLPFDAWRERHEDPADAAKARAKRSRSEGEAKRAETAAASAARPDASKAVAASNTSADPARPAVAPSADVPAALDVPSASEDATPPVRYVQPQPHAGTGAPEDPLLPLRTRTNYASLDCAAAVLRSSSGSKGPTSILSSAKDRYMLTPCNVRDKFVVVELCEEIAIDAVVLANWEFFSSMFKLVRARVSEVFPGVDADWRELGTFRAGNVRGPQVFKPHDRPAGFFRYLRVEFLDHYGTEYYCPVSLLQVYGKTQMEAWKDEERAREREARLLAEEEAAKPEEVDEAPLEAIADPVAEASVAPSATSLLDLPPLPIAAKPVATDSPSRSSETVVTSSSATSLATASSSAIETASSAPPSSRSLSASIDLAATSSPASVDVSIAADSTTRSTAIVNATSGGVRSSARPSAGGGHSLLQQTTSSGESIYGTIMKRLNYLERNSTLSLRYTEDSARVLRSMISRLDSRMAELETSRQTTEQLLRRLVRDFETLRFSTENERHALARQLDILADEIVFERRLGLIQLVALLAVLIFVAVTRSPALSLQHLLPPSSSSRSARLPEAPHNTPATQPRRPVALQDRKSAHREAPRVPPVKRGSGRMPNGALRMHERAGSLDRPRSLTPPPRLASPMDSFGLALAPHTAYASRSSAHARKQPSNGVRRPLAPLEASITDKVRPLLGDREPSDRWLSTSEDDESAGFNTPSPVLSPRLPTAAAFSAPPPELSADDPRTLSLPAPSPVPFPSSSAS